MGYKEIVLARHPLSYYRLGELKSSGIMTSEDDYVWFRVQNWSAPLIDEIAGRNGVHQDSVFYIPPALPRAPFPGMECIGSPYVDDGNLATSDYYGIYTTMTFAGTHAAHIGMSRFGIGSWFNLQFPFTVPPMWPTFWNLPTTGYIVLKSGAYYIRINVGAAPSNEATISAMVYGSGGTESAPFSLTPFTKNAWHYVFLNVKNGVVELFLDGSLVGTGTSLMPGETVGIASNTMAFATSGWSPCFPVIVDEVEIYNSDYSEDPDWYKGDWWNNPPVSYGIIADPDSGHAPLRTQFSLGVI